MLSTLHAQAQGGPESGSSAPNYKLEGDWVRIDTAGSGSFGGLNKNVPKAQLTPAGKALLAQIQKSYASSFVVRAEEAYAKEKLKTGQTTVVVNRPCTTPDGGINSGDGLIAFSPDSSGFHMIIGRTQVIWTGERGGAQLIWMDGRHLPDESHWKYPRHISVGHWENGVLVIKTVGLPTGGGFGIPGGGVRTPASVLTERFELADNGKEMKMISTYWDPKLYVKPHSFTYTFARAFPHYALEDWCDPGNPLDYTSVGPPPQNLK